MPAFRDLTGQKFGRLTVVGRAPNNKCGQACWYCVCEDSNRTVVSTSDLKSGHTVSCGCWHLRHGHAKRGETSPEYRAWQRMKDRCLNPKHQKYRYWGGRGITICDRWVNGDGVKSGFECFLGDMGPKPEPKDEYELDRIDPDGMYELGNCHWATHREASAHTRGVQHVPMPDGRAVVRAQFERELGLPDDKLHHIVRSAKRSITRGACLEEMATKVAIQVTLWMIIADMLKGTADPPQAARTLARLARGKDGAGLIKGNTQR